MAGVRRLAARVDQQDLRWLLDLLWPPTDDVRAFVDEEPPADLVAVETYVVLPNAARPLIVLPRVARHIGLRAMLARPALQSRANLLIRASAAVVMLVGPKRFAAGRLVIATPSRPSGAPMTQRLIPYLGEQLGIESPTAVVLLGPRDPNRKPMLELVDGRGHTVGYAKVGWNAPTGAHLRREARVLERLAGTTADADLPLTPRLLHFGRLAGLDLVVTEPMSQRARRWPNRRPPPLAALKSVAAALAPDGVHHVPLAYLTLWATQRAALADISGPSEPAARTVLSALDTALEGVPADLQVPVGGWHGDWTPWNLATVGGRLWAWDWEHAGSDVPLGFDALHYLFAVLLHVDRVSTDEAVARLMRHAPGVLQQLGVPADAVGALVTGYLVERWLRAHRAHEQGVGWDSAIHPGVVDALRRTLAG